MCSIIESKSQLLKLKVAKPRTTILRSDGDVKHGEGKPKLLQMTMGHQGQGWPLIMMKPVHHQCIDNLSPTIEWRRANWLIKDSALHPRYLFSLLQILENFIYMLPEVWCLRHLKGSRGETMKIRRALH